MELTLLANASTAAGVLWLANRVWQPDVDRATDILLGSAAIGLAVGRLAAMIEAGVNPVLAPTDILIVRGGVDTGFATLGAIVALTWTLRDRFPVALDQLAPSALVGLAGWHGGCVWRGTCLGTATDLPWAMSAAGSDIGRHPVELYTAALLVLAAVAVRRMSSRPGSAFGLALAAAGAVRLLTDRLRLSIIGGPTIWYVAAITVGITFAAFGQRLTRTRPPGPSSTVITPP